MNSQPSGSTSGGTRKTRSCRHFGLAWTVSDSSIFTLVGGMMYWSGEGGFLHQARKSPENPRAAFTSA